MADAGIFIIHPALAPYRVDIFNSIGTLGRVDLLFLLKNPISQGFDQTTLLSQLKLEPSFLDGQVRLFKLAIPKGILRQIRAAKPDVVIATEFSISTVIAAVGRMMGLGYKLVVLTDDNEHSLPMDWPRRFIRRLLMPQIDGWIFISRAARDSHPGHIPGQPSAVVPIIRKEDRYRNELVSAEASVRGLIEKHSLAGKRVLLFVGRLVGLKRLDLIIQAFARAAAAVPDAVFVVVGAGPMLEELQQVAEQCGVADKVIFVGRQEGPELAAWYRIGQLLALFSTSERYGAVVNEALLAGMPALVSYFAGACDLVHDGVNGAIIDPFNIEANAAAMVEWLGKASPLADTAPMRESRMITTFDDGVGQLKALFDQLTDISP